MKPSITITEVEIDNEQHKKIIISGAENHDDARKAAEHWCEEHNSRILDFIQENPSAGAQGAAQAYYAIVSADDYK